MGCGATSRASEWERACRLACRPGCHFERAGGRVTASGSPNPARTGSLLSAPTGQLSGLSAPTGHLSGHAELAANASDFVLVLLAGGACWRRPRRMARLMPVSSSLSIAAAWLKGRQPGGACEAAAKRAAAPAWLLAHDACGACAFHLPPGPLAPSRPCAVWDACTLGANGLVFFWSGCACLNYLIRHADLQIRRCADPGWIASRAGELGIAAPVARD